MIRRSRQDSEGYTKSPHSGISLEQSSTTSRSDWAGEEGWQDRPGRMSR